MAGPPRGAPVLRAGEGRDRDAAGRRGGRPPGLGLYLLRPPVVLGPHAGGGKDLLPGPLGSLSRGVVRAVRSLPVPLPALAPDVPMQFIHEDDVGQAFLLCVVGAGPPGAYNITGDGVLTGREVVRELGLAPVPVPAGLPDGRPGGPRMSELPFIPPVAEWAEAATHPSIMDAAKAKRVLGWSPRYTSLEALRDTIAVR